MSGGLVYVDDLLIPFQPLDQLLAESLLQQEQLLIRPPARDAVLGPPVPDAVLLVQL